MIDETVADESVEAGVPEAEAGADDALQLIAFSLGAQHFCVNIMSVREIRAWTGTTELPNTAAFVRGVINLRGTIVPIMDLRTRFGQGETDPTKSHVVIIVEVGDKLNGLLVDAVTDILTIREDEVQAIPETDGETQNPYLDGLIRQDDGMVALIALDRLIGETSIH
jgi:purine-binding chemotaxis protein CheW